MAFPLDDRTTRAFERPPSFSFIYFDAQVLGAIPDLLLKCGYRPLGSAQFRAPFQEAYWALEPIEEPDNTIVHKGAFLVTGGTVLLDPEMVIGHSNEEQVRAFCDVHSATATVIIWERVSETVAYLEITPDGRASSTLLIRGEPEGPQVAPRQSLRRKPDPEGLRDALQAAGVPCEEVFGEVDLWALKLDEGGRLTTG